jgi:hypothetical protein
VHIRIEEPGRFLDATLVKPVQVRYRWTQLPKDSLRASNSVGLQTNQDQSFWPEALLATASTETPGLRRQTFPELLYARTGNANFARPSLGTVPDSVLVLYDTNQELPTRPEEDSLSMRPFVFFAT